MRMTLCIVSVCATLMATGATAQERAAGGSLETQVTWSALSTKINSMGARVDAANARIDQLVVCGKLGKLYAPGHASADADGCLVATGAVIDTDATKQVTITSYKGDGWAPKDCPAGHVMTGGYWTESDQWAMRCRPLILK